MSFFKKIFGNSEDATKHEDNLENKSPYNPEVPLPVDEMFIHNFMKNGGKFIYCLNQEEVNENFISILEENDWFEGEALCFEPKLHQLLNVNKISHEEIKNPNFILCSCENLIADEGSILFSSNQFKHLKPNELPINMVVFATASQLVVNKSDGLRIIKNRYIKEYPTNITTIKYFEKAKEEDFLNYGSCHKNLYLLLLEDF